MDDDVAMQVGTPGKEDRTPLLERLLRLEAQGGRPPPVLARAGHGRPVADGQRTSTGDLGNGPRAMTSPGAMTDQSGTNRGAHAHRDQDPRGAAGHPPGRRDTRYYFDFEKSQVSRGHE